MSAPRSARDSEHLVDLAVMGSAMARVLFDLQRPTVGLLNIGVEEVKGLEPVREAGRFLREANLPYMNYVGFVEADSIGKGDVDVIVTEGFSGNIAIKTAEGTARQIGDLLRSAMSRTWRSKLGYLLARARLRDAARQARSAQGERRRLPWTERRGDQSHGGTDAEGFASAVDLGYDIVRYELQNKDQRHAPSSAPAKSQR